MSQWQQLDLKECQVQVDPEGIQEVGASVVFPLKVMHPQQGLVLQHAVTLRAEFYHELMRLPDGREHLMRIFRNRLKEEISRRRSQPPVPVTDKVHWTGMTRPLED